MTRKYWLFASQRSAFAIKFADLCLVLCMVSAVFLIISPSLFLLGVLSSALLLRSYLKATCISPTFFVSAEGIGMNDSADKHFLILRPALVTPLCIWLHVRYRQQTPQWILLWRDQYSMKYWRRLRRVANDINY